MSFLFTCLDILLILIMLFDTLGLIYQFRRDGTSGVKKDDYIRICFSWIFFLTLYNLFSCNWAGFFGTLIRLILFGAKAYVTIPKFNGTLKIHKYLIEDKKGEEYLDKIISKICKCNKCNKYRPSAPGTYSETTQPESNEEKNISNE